MRYSSGKVPPHQGKVNVILTPLHRPSTPVGPITNYPVSPRDHNVLIERSLAVSKELKAEKPEPFFDKKEELAARPPGPTERPDIVPSRPDKRQFPLAFPIRPR